MLEQVFIVIDKQIFIELSELTYLNALLTLVAVYFAFNLSYDKRQEIIFQFFEEHILGIHTKKRSLCYRAVCCLCWDLNSDLNCLVERVFVF